MARYKVSGQISVPLLRENLVPSRNKPQGKEKDGGDSREGDRSASQQTATCGADGDRVAMLPCDGGEAGRRGHTPTARSTYGKQTVGFRGK